MGKSLAFDACTFPPVLLAYADAAALLRRKWTVRLLRHAMVVIQVRYVIIASVEARLHARRTRS